MRILFDQGTPAPLRHHLAGHQVAHAYEQGWDQLRNGDLLAAAEAAGFDLLVTSDKNMRHQQNLEGRTIAIVVLGNGQWPELCPYVQRVVEAGNAATLGSYVEVPIPRPPRRPFTPKDPQP